MTISPPSTELADLGRVDDFPLDEFHLVDVDGIEVGVLRSSDGRIRVVRNRCPHRLGPICEGRVTGTMLPCEDSTARDYGMANTVIRCPWHSYEFDLDTGRALFGTFNGRLRIYETVVQDGRLYARIKSGS